MFELTSGHITHSRGRGETREIDRFLGKPGKDGRDLGGVVGCDEVPGCGIGKWVRRGHGAKTLHDLGELW